MDRHSLHARPFHRLVHRPEWASGQIVSSEKTKMIFAIAFTFFWCVVSLPLVFFLPAEIYEKGNTIALVGLVFPAVGIGLLIWAARLVGRFWKFGVFKAAGIGGT